MMRAFLLSCVVITMMGCKKDPVEVRSDTVKQASSKPRDPLLALVSALASAPKAPPPAPPTTARQKALSAEEQATAKAYMAALARGRKATRGKKFAAAIAAFDEALKQKPKDASAVAERGYARLLEKQYDDARKDLEMAKQLANTSALMAQIVYNLGTLEKETGHEDKAKEYHDLSRKLKVGNASAAAAGPCPVEVHRPGTKGEVVDSWLNLWKRIGDEFQKKFNKPYDARIPPVVTDADARHTLTGAKDDGKRAWVVEMEDGDSLSTLWHAVVLLKDGRLLLFASIAQKFVSRCRTGPWAAWIEDDGGQPRVVVESIFNELGYMCEKPNGDIQPCTYQDEHENPVQSFCDPGTYQMQISYIDVDKQDIPLVVEESGPAESRSEGKMRVTTVTQQDGVMLSGVGCQGVEKFRP